MKLRLINHATYYEADTLISFSTVLWCIIGLISLFATWFFIITLSIVSIHVWDSVVGPIQFNSMAISFVLWSKTKLNLLYNASTDGQVWLKVRVSIKSTRLIWYTHICILYKQSESFFFQNELQFLPPICKNKMLCNEITLKMWYQKNCTKLRSFTSERSLKLIGDA